MYKLGHWIQSKSLSIIEDIRLLFLYVFMLSMLPFASIVAVILASFVVLRKGYQLGGLLFLCAMTGHALRHIFFGATLQSVVLGACLMYIPCYLAAVTLRVTISWRTVAAVLFFQMVVALGFVHVFAPDFIMMQFQQILATLKEAQLENPLLTLIEQQQPAMQQIYANYFIGAQALSFMFFTALTLMMARAWQSSLFYPGGFRKELLAFRGEKLSFIIFVATFFLAKSHYVIAINFLPSLCFYFVLAGLSLSFHILNNEKTLRTVLLLGIPLIIAPYVMLPLYLLLGTADSIINFRIYLSRYRQKKVRG